MAENDTYDYIVCGYDAFPVAVFDCTNVDIEEEHPAVWLLAV